MDDKGATFCGDLRQSTGEAPAVTPPVMYLIVLSGGVPGTMLRVESGANQVGRSEDNALQIAEGTISRRHALIRVDDDGNASITDLGSSNGTCLNGRRLDPQAQSPLRDGDRIRVGSNVVVKFTRPDEFEERFQREMFERSVRDPLTGLYHRAYFLEQVSAVAGRAASRGLGLAVLMVDIDHFKRVNDTFGHDAGDSVLREVAATIRQLTRSDDLVARFGGEEFVAALPIVAPDQATDRAERIRAGLAQRRIDVGGRSIRVTASIGLAVAPAGRPRPVSALISSADRGLYLAKRQGRDRVACSSEAPTMVPSLSTVDD